jgi:periplasmic divalent cation tolerance protein
MTTPGDGFAVVLTTTSSDEQAGTLARALLDRRLAACVNVVPRVRSLYRWQDAIQDDAEHLLVIKTRASGFEALRDAIRELHAYDTPEIVMLPVADGDPDYLAWLARETSAEDGSETS